jgi:hypothetical protein
MITHWQHALSFAGLVYAVLTHDTVLLGGHLNTMHFIFSVGEFGHNLRSGAHGFSIGIIVVGPTMSTTLMLQCPVMVGTATIKEDIPDPLEFVFS